MGIIDLLSIIPTYLVVFYAPIGSLIDIRVMRFIRIFRIFQLSPYLRSGHKMQIALRSSRPKIIVFILYILLVDITENPPANSKYSDIVYPSIKGYKPGLFTPPIIWIYLTISGILITSLGLSLYLKNV